MNPPTEPSQVPSPPASAPLWTDADLTNPHEQTDKAQRVQQMFAAIARSYDLNNRVHSLWQDQHWRRSAVKAAQVLPSDSVLDCACGTGDLTIAFARAGAKSVIGLDFTREMLHLAESKVHRLIEQNAIKPDSVRFVQGDAQHLPFEDASFDIISIAFGIRNVQDPAKAVREFHRVLVPGGRLVILEFDRPKLAPVRWFNDLYCGHIMPRTATLISHDKSGAYKYLPKSVGTFMSSESLAELLKTEGFVRVSRRVHSLGICIRTLGHKPVTGE